MIKNCDYKLTREITVEGKKLSVPIITGVTETIARNIAVRSPRPVIETHYIISRQ